jgi:hypothetical protein
MVTTHRVVITQHIHTASKLFVWLAVNKGSVVYAFNAPKAVAATPPALCLRTRALIQLQLIAEP